MVSKRRIEVFVPTMAALVGLALVGGCGDNADGGSSATGTDATALSGTTIDGDGYTFELAEGFEEGDAAAIGESFGDAAAGFTVDAVATGETLDGFATNVNVVITETSSDDLDQLVEDALAGVQEELDNLGLAGAEIEVSVDPFKTAVSGEEARQYEFVTTADTAAYTQRQILVLHDGVAYTVTFSAANDAFDEQVADFTAMMETWAWDG